METEPREVLYYKKEEGVVPFLKWLYSIEDRVTKAKIRIRIDRVAAGDLGDYRSVGDGVNELRLNYGPGYRIYFGFDGQKIIGLPLLACLRSCCFIASSHGDIRNIPAPAAFLTYIKGPA